MRERALKERELIISLHEKGKTTREIATLLDISKSKAAFWIKRYSEQKSLENLPRCGRPNRLTATQSNGLKKVLLGDPPSRYGGESFGWTTKEALKYVAEQYGIKYTDRNMRKIFHKIRLNLITPRTEHRHDSYATRTVYREDFKKNSRRNIWVAPSSILTKHPSD